MKFAAARRKDLTESSIILSLTQNARITKKPLGLLISSFYAARVILRLSGLGELLILRDNFKKRGNDGQGR